jgi:hypothetical protein
MNVNSGLRGRPLVFWSALIVTLLMTPTVAVAQAWVPHQGQGSLTFSHQRISHLGHRLIDGFIDSGGRSTNMSFYVQADYAFTDRLSFSAGLPFVLGKYTDPNPPPPRFPFLPIDQCRCWNSGFQDFSLAARYNLINGTFAFTPSVSVGVPSHDYAYQGEAVLGRNLHEVRIALDAGRRLDFLSPRLSIEGGYSYAFVERTLDIGNNRSNASILPAYQLQKRLSLRGILIWQHTHGGLNSGSPTSSTPGDINTPERIAERYRTLRDNYWHAGAGTTYSFDKMDVFGTYTGFVTGTNTHRVRTFTIGISFPFRTGERP